MTTQRDFTDGQGMALVITQQEPTCLVDFALHDRHGRITSASIHFDELDDIIAHLEYIREIGKT